MEDSVARAGLPLGGARRRLAEELRRKGINDSAVLAAIEATPRHLFVPSGVAHRAYEDSPILIGSGQTISQPFVHARSLELLRLSENDRVLEVGTGSGYQTALLAQLARHVYSIERVPALHEGAADALRSFGVGNVTLKCSDGTAGWPEYAPFDAIVVSAGAPDIPAPLVDQMAAGGRMVVPVGARDEQKIALLERTGNRIVRRDFDAVRFVPLIGEHGWAQ